MIRVIVREQNWPPIEGILSTVEYKTFEILAPELEAFLLEPKEYKGHWYGDRSVVGVEVVKEKK